MLLWFTATNLDTCHHIWYHQTNYFKLLLGSYERDHDQPERLADLDLWRGKYEPDLDSDFSVMFRYLFCYSILSLLYLRT